MILVLLPAFSAWPEQGPQNAEVRQDERSASTDAASELVLRAIGGKPSPTLVTELAALGPEVIPFLLQVLTKQGMLVGGEAEKPLVLRATPELQEQLLSALAMLPREPLLQHLGTSAASTDFDERVAGLRVLGRMGTNEQMELLASLGAPTGPKGLVPTKVRTAFQEALVKMLERDPKAFTRFPEMYARIPQALIFPMIRAAEEETPLRAIEMLAGLLGTRVEADPFLLSELARLAWQNPMPTPKEVCVKPRRYLSDHDPQRLSAAVMLAGAFGDYEAVPQLTRLLDHDDPHVARGARSALGKIARKDLGKQPGPWTAWYQKESDWWRSKATAIGQDLRGRDPAKAAAAVMELGARRMRRDDAALMLAEGLVRPEADIVRTCCQAIGYLGSPLAVPALETAAQHEDLRVSEAAKAALAHIRRVPGA